MWGRGAAADSLRESFSSLGGNVAELSGHRIFEVLGQPEDRYKSDAGLEIVSWIKGAKSMSQVAGAFRAAGANYGTLSRPDLAYFWRNDGFAVGIAFDQHGRIVAGTYCDKTGVHPLPSA